MLFGDCAIEGEKDVLFLLFSFHPAQEAAGPLSCFSQENIKMRLFLEWPGEVGTAAESPCQLLGRFKWHLIIAFRCFAQQQPSKSGLQFLVFVN